MNNEFHLLTIFAIVCVTFDAATDASTLYYIESSSPFSLTFCVCSMCCCSALLCSFYSGKNEMVRVQFTLCVVHKSVDKFFTRNSTQFVCVCVCGFHWSEREWSQYRLNMNNKMMCYFECAYVCVCVCAMMGLLNYARQCLDVICYICE